MSDVLFYQQLDRLKYDVSRLQNTITDYELTDSSKYPENFEKVGLDVAMQAEAVACTTRSIVSSFMTNGRTQLIHDVAKMQGIRIEENKLGYEIIMPSLMKKRSGKHSVMFLLEPLSYALKRFANTHSIDRMSHAVIWFIYEYAEDVPMCQIRDYDNIEAKEVLDLINTHFLVDDGGRYCELHYSIKRGKRNRTRVVISEDIGLFLCSESEKI